MRAIRWGFLGAGYVASRALAPAAHAASSAVLQVVAARDPDRAAALEPRRIARDYAEVCSADDVDAVYIALSNDNHLPWVLRALESGKHVLCEKPLGLNAAEVARMTSAAERAGLIVVEAAWNRWHPRTRRLVELLDSAPGERVVEAVFTFDGVPAANYRLDSARGGGALLDVGCYVVALSLAALGAGPVTVESVRREVGATGVDLTTEAALTHPNGRTRILASFAQPETQFFRVDTAETTLALDSPAFTSWREPATLRIVERDVSRVEEFPACDAYQLMIDAVSQRISGTDAWTLPLTTSAETAAVLDAITAR